MRKFFIPLVILWLLLTAGAWMLAVWLPEVVNEYQRNARTPIFSGFITLGSFLLTLKTTILQRLKDGFDSEEHKRAYLYLIGNGGTGGYYDSLSNMSIALSWSVFLAISSSALQLTIGFVYHQAAFAVCVSTPATTLAAIVYLWREISIAHRSWIQKIEEDKQRELSK